MGRRRKSEREGRTNQNIALDSLAIFITSLVSKCIQNIAISDMSGIDAKIAPISELRFEISEMSTINMDEMITLLI